MHVYTMYRFVIEENVFLNAKSLTHIRMLNVLLYNINMHAVIKRNRKVDAITIKRKEKFLN